ncbi:hypothetical protein NSU_0325 [Novosphingobium pentaromativorans US6-1]|uniref:Phage head morphogenesis domain-containing protein n=2 Tax=Novosphingobium pentaromativorans TaxID=205844 RepID=G6E7J0_9SPHN|nr:hypothetical protein NSU_0325 [Novosphingobium pentaromativorans US6-1]
MALVLMAYNLAAMARQRGIKRNLTFRPIEPTQANAQALAAIYLPVLKAWDVDSLMRGYEQPAKGVADAMVLDAPSDQAANIEQAEREATRLIGEFTAGLREWVVRAERWHRGKWTDAVKAAIDIDLSMMLTMGDVSETVEAFIARNVALVRNVSDQAQGRIADAVYRGYEQRLPARDVAKNIREAVAMGRDRSLRIAADQNSKLSAALDRKRRDEAGVSLFKYRHSGKVHARPWHKARDGKIYDSATGKQVNPDGTAMKGGDVIEADDRAGMPPWCGCREQAYLPIMAEIGA